MSEKMKIGEIHNLLILLIKIGNDPEAQLPGRVKRQIARNMEALQPHCAKYEADRMKAFKEIAGDAYDEVNGKIEASKLSDPGMVAWLQKADADLRSDEVEVILQKFNMSDDELDRCKAITPVMMTQLRSVMDDAA